MSLRVQCSGGLHDERKDLAVVYCLRSLAGSSSTFLSSSSFPIIESTASLSDSKSAVTRSLYLRLLLLLSFSFQLISPWGLKQIPSLENYEYARRLCSRVALF